MSHESHGLPRKLRIEDNTLQVLNHSIRNLFVLCAYGNEQAEYNLGDEARIIA